MANNNKNWNLMPKFEYTLTYTDMWSGFRFVLIPNLPAIRNLIRNLPDEMSRRCQPSVFAGSA